MPRRSDVEEYLEQIRMWCKPSEFDALWSKCLLSAKRKWKKRGITERHALRLLLNELLNEGEQKVSKESLMHRMWQFDDHIQLVLEHTTADYNHLINKDILDVEDIALMEAIKNEGFQKVFGSTPSEDLSNDEWQKYYVKRAESTQKLIDKYRPKALQSMGKLDEMDRIIADVVPNRKAYKEAHEATNLAEFLEEVDRKESDETLNKMIEDFVSTHII